MLFKNESLNSLISASDFLVSLVNNQIYLGLWTKKAFEDVISGFGKHCATFSAVSDIFYTKQLTD